MNKQKNFDLKPDKTHAIGSFRLAMCKQETLIAVWRQDRRDVYLMSTMHDLSATTVLKRPKGEHEKKPTLCPTAIADYNKYMGGLT